MREQKPARKTSRQAMIRGSARVARIRMTVLARRTDSLNWAVSARRAAGCVLTK
jgi:hypothetical protein